MNASDRHEYFHAKLTDMQFRKIVTLVRKTCGINLTDIKRKMVETRLRKRLKALSFSNFNQYFRYLFNEANMDQEMEFLLDVITTNKTDFFREPEHFSFLYRQLLPELMAGKGAGLQRKLQVWSAGCSSGEEPYTIAMVLAEFKRNNPGLRFQFQVLASDVSNDILEQARTAVYKEDRTGDIPPEMLQRYFMRSKNPEKQLMKVVPEIRETVSFRNINFITENFSLREKMDLIFCRNVIIYFDRKTQEEVLLRLLSHLNEGGYLFLGHSENTTGMHLPAMPVAPTIYRKQSKKLYQSSDRQGQA